MSVELEELYRDILLVHYKYPRGKKTIINPDIENQGQNPLCGDSIKLQLKLDQDSLQEIGVSCAGCAICAASSSMLAEIVEGKPLDEVKKIAAAVRELIKGETPSGEIEMGDLKALEGVKKFPVRIKCALLAWTTLMDTLEAWERGAEMKVTTTE